MPDWLQILVAAVTIVGIAMTLHFQLLKRAQERQALAIKQQLDLRLDPVVRDLEDVTKTLKNGINSAVSANRDNIAGMRLDLANLTGQLEQLIPGFHPKEY